MREEKYADTKAGGVRADKSLKDRARKEEAWDTSGGGGARRDFTLARGISNPVRSSFILGEGLLGVTSPTHSPAVVSAHTPHSDAHDGLGV